MTLVVAQSISHIFCQVPRGRILLLALFCFANQFAPAIAQDNVKSPNQSPVIAEIMEQVLRENPEIQASRFNHDVAAEGVAQAWSNALPSISADGSLARQKIDQTVNSVLFGENQSEERNFQLNPVSASVSAEQVLFDGLQTVNTIREAGARKEVGFFEVVRVEQDVLRRTGTAYFSVLQNQRMLKAVDVSIEAHLAEVRGAKARLSRGEGTITDVRQAEARLASVQSRRVQILSALGVSRAQLEELSGSADVSAGTNSIMIETPPLLDEAHELAIQNAPSLALAKATLKASKFRQKAGRGAIAPRVSAFVSYQINEEPSPFTVRDEQFQYGVRASIPLVQGGLRLSMRREARAQVNSERASLRATERQLRAQITTLWRRMEEAEASIYAAEIGVQAASSALDGVRAEARAGLRTTVDVLDTEGERAEAEIRLVQGQSDLQVSKVNLLAAIGVLDPLSFLEE